MRYAVRMTGYTDVAFDEAEAANAFSADMARHPVVERLANRSRFLALLSACLRYHPRNIWR